MNRSVATLGLVLALACGARVCEAQDVYAHIDAISSHIQDVMKKYDVTGVSIAIFRDFQLEWARGYGLANLDTKQPVDSLTLFQAASISKPVTALATMRLVQQGRLDLDNNVNLYLKSWKLPENDLTRATPVTLRHILSHTAGLTVHGFRGYEEGQALPVLPQILDGQPPANSEAVRVTVAPGTKFEYSGGGYTILQQLLIDVTGMPFPKLMRELALDPVGLRFSTYEQPLPENLIKFASAGHEPHGHVVKGERHTYAEMAAAGLSTTPSDLARFAMAIQRASLGYPNAILSKELARLMITPYIPGSFGLGFEATLPRDKEMKYFGHTGGNVGYRCELLATREGGNGVAVMVTGDEYKAILEIRMKVLAEYGW